MAVIAKQRYKLDIAPKGGWVIVYASQHDNGAREIEFEITNQGNAFSIPASINVSVQGIKSNKSYFSHSCSYSGNVVTMALADDMTDVIGKAICVLKFTNQSNQKLATAKFVLNIDTDSSSEGIIIDTEAEEIFNQMLNDIRAQAASISADIAELQSMVGSPLVASTVSVMTDRNKIYVYTGSESGYTNGNWYYWNGSAWTSGGVYNSTAFETDKTLSVENMAADAKATGDLITELDNTVNGVVSRNYTEGKNFYIYGTTHNIIDDARACISDYIPVTWGTNKIGFCYTDDGEDSNQYYLWFFTSEKEYIAHYSRNSAPTISRENLSTPSNAAYVRFSFKRGFSGKLTENNSASAIIYFSATDTIESPGLVQDVGELDGLATRDKSSLVGAVNELKSEAVALPITPKDTDFFHVSGNLIDPEAWVDGEYVNQENGRFNVNRYHHRTGYINVDSGQSYCMLYFNRTVATDTRYVFYDHNKEYISGELISLPAAGDVINAPDNAKYIVISNSSKSFPMMLKKSSELIPFEDYGNTYILEKFIRNSDVGNVVINLPKNIYALVGYECNIYFENLVECWDKYKWDVSCSVGMQLERGYRINPTEADVGTYILTIKLIDDNGNNIVVSTNLVVTSASAKNGVFRSVIVMGDSTTYNGIAITKLNDNFSADVMSISTIGTMGTAPNKHEGRSGWKMEDYFTKEYIVYPAGDPRGTINNPFYNPTTQTFDASYYFDNSGVSKPDWFIINMGINDTFSYATDSALDVGIEEIIGRYDLAIESILEASPNTKIGICVTIPPNHSQDAFGKAYNCSQTRDRYKRNNVIWANALITKYSDKEEDSIYLIPIHTNLDTVYNMGMETLPVNSRNPDITYQSPISNGGVHPVVSGYWQIADVYTAFLKANA